MVNKCSNLFLLVTLLVFSILFVVVFSVDFVSSDFDTCWDQTGTDNATCVAAGNCVWKTSETSDWCEDAVGCCEEKMCWQFDGTNESYCENSTLNGNLNCTWDPYMNIYLPNGSLGTQGGCMNDWGTGGDWGGMTDGCWQNDGNKGACTSGTNSQKCSWKANDANQVPWCWIKTLFDAQMENPSATTNDIGCCDMKGCWDYDGNYTQCVNNSAFVGLCTWVASASDPWCPDSTGCCYMKWCSEAGTNETMCDALKQNLMQPCVFTGGACTDQGGGGFFGYNDTDSCMMQGGWWNSSGDCEMPSTDGGGGFMFADSATCWFADNQEAVCRNMTGCVYCNDTNEYLENGTAAIGAMSGTGNETSACYNMQVGYCQGHQDASMLLSVGDIATDSLGCIDVQIKSACNYGPLPNCLWNSSQNLTGPYCASGTSTTQNLAPPVGFCEHPDAVNNFTLCTDLSQKYMMPCKWGNASSNKTLADNCTFNSNAVFGTGEKEYEIISSETNCVAAGGTWNTEYYLEDGALKQDAWCEKGAMFDLATGVALGGKGNCDLDCWACEFQINGTKWSSQAVAEQACKGSVLGYCGWTNDTSALNSQGWCDYPSQMSYGAGDCQTNCKDCNIMIDQYNSCVGSVAGCKWVNDTASTTNQTKLATGKCVGQDKKVCETDCFSCYDFSSCNASSVNCAWDSSYSICSPFAFEGEICFDGMDNDGDGMMDCADPDCSFDMSCGGSAFGNCEKYSYDSFFYDSVDDSVANCTDGIAFENTNCTWMNFTWEDLGHCGMPGEDCWLYDNNMTLCGETTGCTNTSTASFNNFCDMNMTKSETANCWNYTTEATCNVATGAAGSINNCTWVNSTWGGDYGGWCDYWIFAQCMGHEGDQSSCEIDGNCTWNTDWDVNGFCDIACFNHSLDESGCDGISGGACEWRDAETNMCFPSTFEMMGGGGGGGNTGCAQYNGNISACVLNNYTCTWINDSNVENNVSGSETTDGWCNSKGDYELTGDMKGEPTMLGMDADNVAGAAESGVFGWVDIMGFGIRVTDNSYGFGIGTYNITDAAYCNGFPIYLERAGGTAESISSGTGINITQFYWYLDTNSCYDGDQGNTPDPCGTDAPSCGVNLEVLDDGVGDVEWATADGFEFYIFHEVKNNTNTGKIQTKKQLYRCTQNSSGWNWVPTNVFISDDKKFTCYNSYHGAVFVSVEKEALENFPEFDITQPLTVFVTSSDGSDLNSMDDGLGPGYYTPGTIDFEFIDCSDTSVKDPKCKNFQKFGFQTFEDCKNNVDDDADGYTDCDDPKCLFTPVCASGTAFNFVSNSTDFKAPIVVFSKVDKMADAAIIMFDTDEPANGSLRFYKNDSTCNTINTTIEDVGSTLAFDDYKPTHRVALDSDNANLNYSLSNTTTYYYKVKVCDPSNNCGTSTCLNFTTRKQNKNFIFTMDIPDDYTVDLASSTGFNYSGNFTTNISGNIYDIGIKTNASVTKNMNITVNYSDLSIKFIGVDLYKPKALSLDGAFIVDDTNDILGMNSSSKAWHQLASDLGVGGAGDYIELDFSVVYSSSNNLTWYDDAQTSGDNVVSYTTCFDGGASNTKCKVPTSLGFSVYQFVSPSGSSPSSSPSSGGSSVGNVTVGMTYSVSESQFKSGYNKQLQVNDRIKFTVEGSFHYAKLLELTTNTAKIEVTSDSQEAILAIGDMRRFDVLGDGFYDLSVTLNKIENSKADLTVKSIHEEVTEETIAQEQEKEKTAEEMKKEDLGETEKKTWLWVLLGVIVVVVVWVIIKIRKK